MFIKALSTTLLQLFCKLMLHLKVIFKSMTGPDDTGQVDCSHANLLPILIPNCSPQGGPTIVGSPQLLNI